MRTLVIDHVVYCRHGGEIGDEEQIVEQFAGRGFLSINLLLDVAVAFRRVGGDDGSIAAQDPLLLVALRERLMAARTVYLGMAVFAVVEEMREGICDPRKQLGFPLAEPLPMRENEMRSVW